MALGLAMTSSAIAAETPNQVSTEVSNRMSRRLGFYLGVNEPAPVIVGANAAYHVTDFLRASVGYGKVATASGSISGGGMSINLPEASATTMGFGARAYMPGWNLSPALGLGFSHVSYSGTPGFVSVGGFKESGSHVYASLGADYQARSGFNAAAGIQQSFKADVGTNLYVTAGWYVDWL